MFAIVSGLRALLRECALESPRNEAARAGDVLCVEQDRTGLRQRRRRVSLRHVHPSRGEEDVLLVLPGDEEREGSDDPVVAESEQPDRMDLEMQVRSAPVRVTGVPDEADDVARLD